MKKVLTIYISAGEVSGDLHGAELVKALQTLSPLPIRFCGTGGDAMRAAGVDLFHHVDELATMGIWEVIKRIGFFKRLLRETIERVRGLKPDLFISIDYPGFNLRLAEGIRTSGIKAVHYISPKVWVWKANRIPKIAAAYDLLLCIFPFEPRLFSKTGLRAIYVGNPLVAEVRQTLEKPWRPLPWRGAPRIGLLPGSRLEEVHRLMPIMLKAVERIRQRFPTASFLIPTPTERVRRAVCRFALPDSITVISGQSLEVMRQADAAVIASGTATLESVLVGCPTVLIYRVAKLTEWFARCVIHSIRHVGLANIIAEREVIPELLQEQCNPQAVANQVCRLLTDTTVKQAMLNDFSEVRDALGKGDASAAAARSIIDLMRL
ncbi:MAG: lipid-A-disaccharide synthase [Kiritimatiellia bacterium]|nr:lipid-A-disaccharide synthase [Kiritimatiellia bacterium]